MPPIDKNQQIIRDMTQSIYDEERQYLESELTKDATWIEASKMAYRYDNDSEFVGTDEEAAKAGLEMMGKFNYNLSLGTIPMAANIANASDEEKLAFYYMMDTYDKKDISTAGTARFFKNLALDPTTYVGIGSLGWGFGGKAAAGATARAGIKATLKEAAKKYIASTTAVAATEGAIYTSADDLARQKVAVEAGLQESIDPAQTAIAGAMGAAAGAGLVKGGEIAVKGVKAGAEQVGKWAKEGEQAMMEMAGGGIPAYHGTTRERTNIGEGTFFTNKPEYAEQYAGKDTRYYPNRKNPEGGIGVRETYFMSGGQMYPAEIDMKNPKIVTKKETQHDPEIEKEIIKKAKEDGFDSLVIKYEGTDREDYVPFSNDIVKLKLSK